MIGREPGHVVALVAAAPEADSASRAAVRVPLAATARDGAGVLVDTCHRVEAFVVERDGRAAPTGTGARRLEGRAAAEHAISLALGLESTVLGEAQVLHQLRAAVSDARRTRNLEPELEALFALALSAGRRARTWSGPRPPSLADIALDLAGDVAGRTVLVVGTGEMGRLVARAARHRSADVLVAGRTPERAEALARDVAGRAVPFDPGTTVASSAVMVVALAGPWLVGEATRDALADTPLVVDLSQPRAVPVSGLDETGRLVLLDDLRRDAEPDPATARLRDRLVRLRDETLEAWDEWLANRSAADLTRSLAARVERDRREELHALWRRRPGLTESDRHEIDEMTRHLAERLFRDTFARLRQDGDGRRERAARELFGL